MCFYVESDWSAHISEDSEGTAELQFGPACDGRENQPPEAGS